MQLQNTSQELVPDLSSKALNLSDKLYQVQLLTPFKIEEVIIYGWAKHVDILLPDLDLNDLQDLLNDFKTHTIQYDNKLGIQNIFIGLKKKFGSKYSKTTFVI